MGEQTMASQSGTGSGGGGGQRPQIQGLARQGSMYNLTLNEVQNHIGEPLLSMNLDELLKSVFPAEVTQTVPMNPEAASMQYPSTDGIQRQGNITMPLGLSKKTVDEVWKDIQQGQEKGGSDQTSAHERQVTLGEMTLEGFLMKAGIVAEGIAKDANAPIGNAEPIAGSQDFGQPAHWMQHYPPIGTMEQHMQGPQSMLGAYMPGRSVPQPLSVPNGPMLDAVYSDGQINISSPTLGALSDSQTPGRKRAASGDMQDKLVERRQKRMIKNRESAARSRARKQAYTNELENKVSHLEEENERLKKQKELEKILYAIPQPEPRYQLRRTSSAPI